MGIELYKIFFSVDKKPGNNPGPGGEPAPAQDQGKVDLDQGKVDQGKVDTTQAQVDQAQVIAQDQVKVDQDQAQVVSQPALQHIDLEQPVEKVEIKLQDLGLKPCGCGDKCECGPATGPGDNPKRPPKTWWLSMMSRAKKFYPSFSQDRLNRIVGGIWQGYDDSTKYRIYRLAEKKTKKGGA